MRNLIQTIREAVREYFSPVTRVAHAAIPGLPGSKVILSVPKNPAEFDSSDWFQEFKRKNEASDEDNPAALCPWPGCEGHMLEGPSGGMSTNIKCDTCERKWNITPMIERMERI